MTLAPSTKCVLWLIFLVVMAGALQKSDILKATVELSADGAVMRSTDNVIMAEDVQNHDIQNAKVELSADGEVIPSLDYVTSEESAEKSAAAKAKASALAEVESKAMTRATECDESLHGPKNNGYRGCQSKTKTGRTCAKWTSQSPHKHAHITPAKCPGKGLEYYKRSGVVDSGAPPVNCDVTHNCQYDHNYCRNPDGEPSIWCYTTSPSTRWELCNPKAKGAYTAKATGVCKADGPNFDWVAGTNAYKDDGPGAGYKDAYRGWYDVQGCGKCNDYCRWVGNSGTGGDPRQKTCHGISCKSWWSCHMGGESKEHTARGEFDKWSLKKCTTAGSFAPQAPAYVQGAYCAYASTTLITSSQCQAAAAALGVKWWGASTAYEATIHKGCNIWRFHKRSYVPTATYDATPKWRTNIAECIPLCRTQ